MTRLRSIALGIVTRLQEIPALAAVGTGPAMVALYRRADIESRVEAAMAKNKGRAVIVRVLSAKNVKSGKASHYSGKITVSLFSAPALTQRDAEDADDLMTAIEAKLQGWWPDDVSTNTAFFLQCDSIVYGDEPTFDVAVLTLTAPGNFK